VPSSHDASTHTFEIGASRRIASAHSSPQARIRVFVSAQSSARPVCYSLFSERTTLPGSTRPPSSDTKLSISIEVSVHVLASLRSSVDTAIR
jgi:hypothetical protein